MQSVSEEAKGFLANDAFFSSASCVGCCSRLVSMTLDSSYSFEIIIWFASTLFRNFLVVVLEIEIVKCSGPCHIGKSTFQSKCPLRFS